MSFGRGSAYAFTAMQWIARADARQMVVDEGVMTPTGIELNAGVTAGRSASTSAHTISMETGIPLEYLRKILQRLARAGLIVSERGRHGGFVLARDAQTISLLDVMEAVDGELDDTMMLNDGVIERIGAAADSLRTWRADATRDLRQTLSRVRLVDLPTLAQDTDRPLPLAA